MMGMFLGWSSPVIKKLQSPDSGVTLTDGQISWMVSLVYMGCVTSPIPTGLIMDRFGRKWGLYLTAIQGLFSWILLLRTNSAAGVYASRFLGGMVGGSAITVTPIYLCEIAEPQLRGAMNTMFTLVMFVGIMFEYIIGPVTTYNGLNWISFTTGVILSAFLYFIPESPYFYTMTKNRSSAVDSLVWLRCSTSKSDVETELNLIETAVSETMNNKHSIKELITTKSNRKALMMTEALAVIQRASGISVIMAYASSAAPTSWVLTDDQCAIMIATTWIIFSFVAAKTIDRSGRRILLIVSCIGCGLAQGLYGTYKYLRTECGLPSHNWVPFLALVLFSVSYPMGMGSVPLLIQGEVFPANIKGVASGITSTILGLTSFIMNKIYQPIGDLYGYHVNFLIYTICCLSGLVFAIFVLIETKGKTLHEIHKTLSR